MSSDKNLNEFSRRDFAKVAALTTAAALVPADLLAQETKPAPEASKAESAPTPTKLSAASQAEADLAYETLMKKYGARFTEDQKKEIKRLVNSQQGALDKLRAFSVNNSDEPGTVFKPMVPEGKR
jgi:hypothetical protein